MNRSMTGNSSVKDGRYRFTMLTRPIHIVVNMCIANQALTKVTGRVSNSQSGAAAI